MRKNKKYLAMCGLVCSRCNAFIATKRDDNKLRIKTAKEWTERYRKDGRNRTSVKPEDINCNSCLSDGQIYRYCSQCKIRKCGLVKGLKNCKECKNYKCDELLELQSRFY